jgi:hypothetical protein
MLLKENLDDLVEEAAKRAGFNDRFSLKYAATRRIF